eukprot:COSAG04_NODE_19740_length_409_cov_0.838710_2_plen_99_part_01
MSPPDTVAIFDATAAVTAGRFAMVKLQTYDQYGNALSVGGATVAATSTGPGETTEEVTDSGNGRYLAKTQATAVGHYALNVTVDGVDVLSTEFGVVPAG